MALGGGGNVLGLIFRIKADGTKETKEDIRSLRAEFNKEVADIKASGTDAFTSLGSSVGLTTSQMGTLTASVGIATGVIAALAAGSLAAGSAIFALAKSTADYESKLWDTSKTTNFAVETLSALQIAAKNSGTTLEALVPSLAIFQANMVKAQDATSEQAKRFKALGIATTDQEKALRQALAALYAMGETEKQEAAAKALFGRSGIAMLGILKETNGDLDEAAKKYSALGLIVSTESAQAADKFGDSLNIIKGQLAGMARMLGDQIIPTFNILFEVISNDLKTNSQNWQNWGTIIEAVTRGAGITLIAFMNTVAEMGKSWSSFVSHLTPAGFVTAFAFNYKQAIDDYNKAANSGDPASGGGSTVAKPDYVHQGKEKKEKADQGPHRAFEDQLQAIKDAASEREKAYRDESDSLKREFALRLVTQDEYFAQEHEKNAARLKAMQDDTEHELRLLAAGVAKKLITQEEHDKKERAVLNKQSDAQREFSKREDDLQNEEAKKRAQQQLDLERQLAGIQQQARADELSDLQASINAQSQLQDLSSAQRLAGELSLIDKRQKLGRQDYEERKLLLNLERELATTSADRLIAIDNELIASEQRWTAEDKRLTQERIDAILLEERTAATAAAQGASRPRRVNQITDPIGDLGKKLKDLYGMKGTAFFDALSTGMNSIASAAANAVNAFVLFGGAGTSFRKFVAETLSSISQMAVVKAVWELAEGFAMMALAYFGHPTAGDSAAAHFVAAGIYGTLAGVAAIAGRVAAGNEFKNDKASSASGGGAGAGSSGDSGQQKGLPDINIGRFQSVPVVVSLNVNVKRDAGSIVDVVTRDYQNNGPLRQLVVKDGVTARG